MLCFCLFSNFSSPFLHSNKNEASKVSQYRQWRHVLGLHAEVLTEHQTRQMQAHHTHTAVGGPRTHSYLLTL